MKKIIIAVFTVTVILLFAGCATSSDPVALLGTETGELGGLSVAAVGGYVNNGNGSVLISMINKTDKAYSFLDSDVSIYCGNRAADTWELISVWNSEQYLSDLRSSQSAREFFSTLLGVVIVMDAIFSDHPYDYRYSYYYPGYYGFVYNDVLLAGMLAEMQYEMFTGSSRDQLAYVERTVLRSSVIQPEQEFAGWIYFKDSKFTDFRVELKNRETGDVMNMYFSKAQTV
jgi:hypothetical protein